MTGPEPVVPASAVAEEAAAAADGVADPPVAPGPPDGAADFRMAVVSSVTLDLPSQHPQVCLLYTSRCV